MRTCPLGGYPCDNDQCIGECVEEQIQARIEDALQQQAREVAKWQSRATRWREIATMWQGKYAILRLENNRLRQAAERRREAE